jgi:hypothetical protein
MTGNMTTFKSYELKIKVTSLAAERTLIRQNEIHLKKMAERCKEKIAEAVAAGDEAFAAKCRITLAQAERDRESLYRHREEIVSPYTRTALLAYGFLRGKTMKQMEPNRRSEPRWDAVERSILKYGSRAGSPQELLQRLEQFKQER